MSTQSVQTFMNSPLSFFGESITPMHSIPRAELEDLQREAMILRFAEHREGIEMVRKLADRLGVSAVDKFDDIVPLMFSHTAYKSYPAALVDNNRWDLMTRWLAKLTTYDLSEVDVDGCDSIDGWLERLEAQTPLQIVTSSGTTGTFSVIPKDVPITIEGMHIWKNMVFQTFGKEPAEDELNPLVDVIWPNFSQGRFGMTRMVPWMKREFTGGDESRFHALYSGAMDTDLMFLANKMRAAAARGELDRLQLDPKLAARKDEFIAMQQRQMTEVPEFIARMTDELRGKRVFMTSTYSLMYNLASAGLAEGVRAEFASNSAILTGGGAKGQVLPEGYMDVIKEFYVGVKIQEEYAFSEHNGVHFGCEEGRYHLQPWVIPFILDPDSGEPLPRVGKQTGRFAVYDVVNQSHWGGVITGDEVTLEHRFEAPDPVKHAHKLPLPNPMALSDMYAESFDEILDVLTELGYALAFEKNSYIQEAYEACLVSNPMPESLLRTGYAALPALFARDAMRELAEAQVGVDYLEGWVPRRLLDGREIRIRAFGARTLHIPAGNGGLVAGITVLRNALTRSDAIIKAPSNDPLTAMAIARTLADIAPDHPITKHLAVGYWMGGDEHVEEQLYKPEHVEKIVAWGGLASVKHVTKYIQPGLELIALDPKRSATIIGPEAFDSEETMRQVAMRAACDVGTGNQEGCVNARVIYVLSGTDEKGLENANRLGELTYEAMLRLPEALSTKPKVVNRTLLEHIEGSRLTEDWYRVYGGEHAEGAIIVSQIDQAVPYSTLLSGRVANIVPVDTIDKVTDAVNAYTQTIGIYPESLKHELRDRLPLFGAQRLTSLGYAASVNFTIPQDAMEPVRRMCKWIVDEECDPDRVFPLWQVPDSVTA